MGDGGDKNQRTDEVVCHQSKQKLWFCFEIMITFSEGPLIFQYLLYQYFITKQHNNIKNKISSPGAIDLDLAK